MSNLKHNGRLRWAPSYLRNRGQVTRGQKRAMREHWSTYGIRFQHDEVLDLDQHFPIEGPLLIEIGFGMGDHLIALATALPDHRILGIEVHRPGLAAATGKASEQQCENVRLIRGDARLVLTDHLPEAIAQAVFIQFPDPWPKPGDERRRLIQPEMLEVLRRTLLPEGECLITTDVDLYASHCRDVFDEAPGWETLTQSGWQAHRITTRYEEKAIAEGRGITELIFRTNSGFCSNSGEARLS
ncbi:MAG: tRNA (guanosine(46)-N7)-methyltransferase TrmB [Verrucomicrobiota bacterium]